MIKGLSHICYYVKNIEETYHFYVEILSFRLVYDFKNDTGERYGFFLHAGARTFIEFFSGDYNRKEQSSFKHCCFEVDSLSDIKHICESNDIAVFNDKIGKDSVHSCCIEDPDGNIIEFHEYNAQSIQYKYLQESL